MPTPLSLYIHWPFCRKKCPYCDFNSHVRDEIDHARWQRALLTELRTHAQWLTAPFGQPYQLVSIFFGGGTPSLMPPETVAALIAEAKRLWPHNAALEITLEANPTSSEASKFRAFADAGVNRLSMGIQSLRDAELAFLGREHSVSEALNAFTVAQACFPRQSFDLIYARPQQTLHDWQQELQQALQLGLTHLSVYQLTIEENTAFHAAYAKGRFSLPEEDTARAFYDLTQDILEAANLPAYEISNHAQPGQECRHNLAYWQGDSFLGIGPGAHGRFQATGQAAGMRTATACIKSPERWLHAVETQSHGLDTREEATPQDELEARLMMGLRLRQGLVWSKLAELQPEIQQQLTRHPRFQWLQQHGLLYSDPERLHLTAEGRPILNYLLHQLVEISSL